MSLAVPLLLAAGVACLNRGALFGVSSPSKPSKSGRLSDVAVARLLARVGWRGPDLVTAVRIVLGESGGNPRALNVNRSESLKAKGSKYYLSRDRGLFQLNHVAFPKVPDSVAFDAEGNARAAFAVYQKQGGFRPGKSAWWGKSKFHTLRRDKVTRAMVPDVDLIRRASDAVARVVAESGGPFA